MTTKAEARVIELKEQLHEAEQRLKRERGNKFFHCACGKKHRIKDLYLWEYYDTCGGEWEFQEYRIKCPDSALVNRLLWDSEHQVDWRVRNHFEHSARIQFSNIYSELFKKVQVERFGRTYMGNKQVNRGDPEDKLPWLNNYCFDHNHEHYGIFLCDFDYAKFKASLKETAKRLATRIDAANEKAKATK